jgi:tetratricopeptide (TPR) repeat protein
MLWNTRPETIYFPVILDLARRATALRPYVVENWQTLAQQLLQADEVEDAIAILADAISNSPTEPALYLTLANAYLRARRVDLAREVLHRAPAVQIDDRKLTIFRLELLMKTGNVKEAAQAATDALALDPTNRDALTTLGRASREHGRPDVMIPFCQEALKLEPGHTYARYQLAVAFAMLGRSEEARQLIDLDKFITVTEVPTPECYVNAEAFEAALGNEIARNLTLRPDPVGTATEGGFQTSRFPQVGDRAVVVLLDLIRSAIDAFAASLPEAPYHPFVAMRPKRAELNAWAVVYPGGGRQSSHIHPHGWLSGVYYVSVPKASCDNLRCGCLVLGTVEIKGLSDHPPWGIRDIRPVPGQLVLFPSYIPHAAIPTRSTDARICIAFDVVPSRPDLP